MLGFVFHRVRRLCLGALNPHSASHLLISFVTQQMDAGFVSTSPTSALVAEEAVDTVEEDVSDPVTTVRRRALRSDLVSLVIRSVSTLF